MEAIHIQTNRQQDATLDEAAIARLDHSLTGELIRPTDEAYDEARKVWNGLIDKHPALIARCANAADVMIAVNFAKEHNVLMSVRGGGHNVAGRALCDNGLVVDLSLMRGVRVDPIRRTVQVQGGATLGDIDGATQTFGLAVPMGLISATGIGGLTLHGGMGWLTRKYGLTIDNLLSVDIVTADGQLRKASDTEHADLFWAIRGGGGNFGIVTSFEFRAYSVGPEVWFLAPMYPLSDARRILQFVNEFVRSAPEELSVLATLWSAPNEEPVPPEYRRAPVIVLLGCYIGPFDEGERIIKPLRELGEIVADFSGPTPFTQVQRFLDADYPDGLLYYWKSAYLEELSEEVIHLLVGHAATRPSSLSSLDIWFLGGAMNQVPADKTAFARRDMTHLIGIESNWMDPEQSNTNMVWARNVFQDLQQFAHGTYLNFPGFMEDSDKLLQGAYEVNYERLQTIKAKYDPDNLFHGALNIVPAGG